MITGFKLLSFIFKNTIDFNLFINTSLINILGAHTVYGKVMGQYSVGWGNFLWRISLYVLYPRENGHNTVAWWVCLMQGFYKQKIFLVVNNHISSLPFQTSLLSKALRSLGREAGSGPRPRLLLLYDAKWPGQGKCFLRLITHLPVSKVLHSLRMAVCLPAS